MNKSLIKVPFMVLILTVFSCSKKQNVDSDIDLRLSKIKSIGIKADRKMAYGMLSAEEKAIMWINHINTIRSTIDLDTEKEQLLAEARVFLAAKNFSIHSNLSGNGKFEIWKYKVSKSFTMNQIALFFNDLTEVTQNDNRLSNAETIDWIDNSTSKCFECNASGNGDFCGNMNSSTPCLAITYKCRINTTCVATNTGCGWFWLNECDGTCIMYTTTC